MYLKYNNIDSFDIFISTNKTKQILENHYEINNYCNPHIKSFENCYRFIYFIKQGQLYYKQAKKAPMSIKPTLLFYGLINIIKACILIEQPNYPEKTAMLAHGVSSRKKKKQQYDFFTDEVKCQKNGLFPLLMGNLFNINYLEGSSYKMEQLLISIPELNDYFSYFKKKECFLPLIKDGEYYYLNKSILNFYFMTETRFITYINNKTNLLTVTKDNTNENYFKVIINKLNFGEILPLKFNIKTKQFVIPTKKDEFLFFPEIMSHYLLLYNLSMIARYETEWWSEINFTMADDSLPFIHYFINLTTEKSPFLLYNYLTSIFLK